MSLTERKEKIMLLVFFVFALLFIFFGSIFHHVDVEKYYDNTVYVPNTLVEKYQETDDGHILKYFRIELSDGEIILREIEDETTYLFYKEGNPVELFQWTKSERNTGKIVEQYYYVKEIDPNESTGQSP